MLRYTDICSYIACKSSRFFRQPKIADLAGTIAYEKVGTYLIQRTFWYQIKSTDFLNGRHREEKNPTLIDLYRV